MKSVILILLAILSISTSNESSLKTCPKVNVIKPFEVNKFLGTWYQFAISGDLFRNPCEKSVTLDWALSADSKNITITTYRFCSKGMICRRRQTIWKAVLGDPDEKTGQIDGKLNLTVNQPDFRKTSVDLIVLNTDYVNSAVLYTCSVLTNRTMAIWILTRKQKHTDIEMADILTTVDATLETNHLDQYEFRLSNPSCESIVANNSKAGQRSIQESDIIGQKLPASSPLSTNNSRTLQPNTDSKPGTESKSSNNTTRNENSKSEPNPPLALLEENHNKTLTLLQKLNELGPTAENLLKQIPKSNSVHNNVPKITLNSTVDTLLRGNGKDEHKKQENSSIPENLPTPKHTNDSLNKSKSIIRTLNIDDYNQPDGSGKNKTEKNKLYSVLDNILKQRPTNESFCRRRLNRNLNFNSNISNAFGSNVKNEPEINKLYSVINNLSNGNPRNDSFHSRRLNRKLNFNSNSSNAFGSNIKNEPEIDKLNSIIINLNKENPRNDSLRGRRLRRKFNSNSNSNVSSSNSRSELEKNKPYTVIDNLHKQTPRRESFGNRRSNRKSNSNSSNLSGSNDKGKLETNKFYSVLDNLLKEKSTNNNFPQIKLSSTLNSNSDKQLSSTSEENPGKNIFVSLLENFLPLKPKNNDNNNNIQNKLPNKEEKRSRRNRSGKRSKHKSDKFEQEQNALEDNSAGDSYNQNGYGGHCMCKTVSANEVKPEKKVSSEGLFPALAKAQHTLLKFIPKAFNVDLWRI